MKKDPAKKDSFTYELLMPSQNGIFVKVFGDGIRILWDIGKQLLVCRRQRALEEHESKIYEVGGYRQHKLGTSAAESEHSNEGDDHEHDQLNDRVDLVPARAVEMALSRNFVSGYSSR